jgi:hypothetical protein
VHEEIQATAITRGVSANDKRSLVRLALGASLGTLFAVLTLFGDAGISDWDDSKVASINGIGLELEEYQRAVQLFASEKRSAITLGDRSLILERMIEEELLSQYGVEAGLVRSSPAVRSEVLRSVMAGLTTEFEAGAIEDEDRHTEEQARDGRLVKYLGQLRDGATIRWAASEGEQ